jgi:AraC family transcriptional regulator
VRVNVKAVVATTSEEHLRRPPLADDRFAAFVDTVSRHLDDHDFGGDAIASSLHLSRFHFDRVMSAIAGEPPGRFRRRILLERAAYRLVSTATSVLDIAVEAGYSSHEAFTRAFARAFGLPPSSWRSAPTRIELSCPNGVHFHPPGGLHMPARDKETSMDLVVAMVEHHLHVLRRLIAEAGKLSADQLDRPITLSVEGVDRDPTIRSLLARLVGQMAMWNASMASAPYDFDAERGQSLRTISTVLDVEGVQFLAHVRAVADGNRLAETFVDATCTPAEVFSYGGMIAHVLTYAAHRRTLVTGALESAGLPVDDDPIRWVTQPSP